MARLRLHPTADLGPAQWLADPPTGFGGRVDQMLPPGYPAYARLFHRPDQGRPDEGSAETWHAVATRHGTVLHPEAQWLALTRGQDGSPHHAGPDSTSDQPLSATLDQRTLPRLAGHLARHTSTPETCHFALWVGFGSAPRSWDDAPTFRRPGRQYWLFPPAPVSSVVAHAVEFEVAGVEEESRRSGGVRGLLIVGRPAEPQDSRRWVDYVLAEGFVRSPTLWWPEDRAWVVHSEVDFDSTLIAGPSALLADLLADGELECLEVQPTTSLEANADRINVV